MISRFSAWALCGVIVLGMSFGCGESKRSPGTDKSGFDDRSPQLEEIKKQGGPKGVRPQPVRPK
jgi:hypothetical protein